MKFFIAITDRACHYLGIISMAIIAFLMCFECADLLVRYALKVSIPGSGELVPLLMAVLIFTSWTYTQSVHGHTHVTFFIGILPRWLRFLLRGLTSVLAAGVLCIAARAQWQQAWALKAQAAALAFFPRWPFVLAAALSLGLLAVILARDALKAVLAIFNREYADEIQSTWN